MCQRKITLVRQISALLLQVKATNPRPMSLEWYLSNNLNSYLNNVNKATKPVEVYHAARMFNHFCVDSLDSNSPFSKKSFDVIHPGLKFGDSSK